VGGNRLGASCEGRYCQGSGCRGRIPYRQGRGGGSNVHYCRANYLRFSCGSARNGVVKLLAVQGENQLTRLGYGNLEGHEVIANLVKKNRAVRRSANIGISYYAVIREGNVCSCGNRCGVVTGHKRVKVCVGEQSSGLALWTLRPNRSGCAGCAGGTCGALRTCFTLRSLLALWTLRTNRSGCAGCACGTCGTLRTYFTLRSLLALWTLRSNRSCCSGCAGGTYGTLRTCFALRALLTLRALRTNRSGCAGCTGGTYGTLRTYFTLRSLLALWALRTNRSGCAGCTGGTYGTLRTYCSGVTGCACGALLTLRSLRSNRSGCARKTYGALRALRSRRTLGTGRTLNTLRTSRPYRTLRADGARALTVRRYPISTTGTATISRVITARVAAFLGIAAITDGAAEDVARGALITAARRGWKSVSC